MKLLFVSFLSGKPLEDFAELTAELILSLCLFLCFLDLSCPLCSVMMLFWWLFCCLAASISSGTLRDSAELSFESRSEIPRLYTGILTDWGLLLLCSFLKVSIPSALTLKVLWLWLNSLLRNSDWYLESWSVSGWCLTRSTTLIMFCKNAVWDS